MDLEQIEQQRRHLEAQVASLRESLKHWQTWDAEYEGFKEELQAAGSKLDKSILVELSQSYNGALVTEKEIRDLSGLSSGSSRTRKQIIDLIDHRLVYVCKNIETLSRQYYAAEGKLEEFDFAAAIATGVDPRFDDEGPQSDPSLIEIHEELDDNDNIITSELRRPDLETQNFLDKIAALQASGQTAAGATVGDSPSPVQQSTLPQRPPARKKSVSFSADTKVPEQQILPEGSDGKKSVSFAAKVAVAPAAAPADNRSVSFASNVVEIPSAAATQQVLIPQEITSESELQQQLRSSFKPGEVVYELNDDEEPAIRHVIHPESESAEDAEMRRQMLNYHLNEVGSVVASLDMDDGYGDDHSDFASSENPDDLDTPYTTGTSDDEYEDEHGRLKGSGISAQYRAQMSALSARLMRDTDQSDMVAVPTPESLETQSLPFRSGLSSLSSVGSSVAETKERLNSKKRVSFAEVLDVAASEAPPAKVQKGLPSSPHPAKISSNFASDIQQASDEENADDDDAGPIVSETLVERSNKQTHALPPSSEDADLLMSKRELASEYYRRRNDMLREQGSFKSSHDDDNQLYEEREGKVKKVSRFKAARLHD